MFKSLHLPLRLLNKREKSNPLSVEINKEQAMSQKRRIPSKLMEEKLHKSGRSTGDFGIASEVVSGNISQFGAHGFLLHTYQVPTAEFHKSVTKRQSPAKCFLKNLG